MGRENRAQERVLCFMVAISIEESGTGGRASLTSQAEVVLGGGQQEWTGARGNGNKGPPSLSTPWPLALGLTKPAPTYMDESRFS